MKRKGIRYPLYATMLALALLGTACASAVSPEGQTIKFETYGVTRETTLHDYNTGVDCFIRVGDIVTIDPELKDVATLDQSVYEVEQVVPAYLAANRCEGAMFEEEAQDMLADGGLVGRDLATEEEAIYTTTTEFGLHNYNTGESCNIHVNDDFSINFDSVSVWGVDRPVYEVDEVLPEYLAANRCTGVDFTDDIEQMINEGKIVPVGPEGN